LVGSGETVLVLDNLTSSEPGAFNDKVQFVKGNVGDRPLVDKLIRSHGIETVFHLAGSTIVPESIVDPLFYYQNNTVNSRTLIEASVKGGVKHFIFSSTAAVYGDAQNIPITEEVFPQPLSPYGSSKLMTELMLRDTGIAHKMSFVVLRYFNVAGMSGDLSIRPSTKRATHLIEIASEVALGKRRELEIFGFDYLTPDGTCIRDYIHVWDLASAHIQALGYLREGNRSIVLNCGCGHGTSVLEVVNVTKNISGTEFRVVSAGRRLGDPARIVADCSLIRSVLEWEPRYSSLERMVSDTLAWERKSLQIVPSSHPV
jgi:UDP-glucose 4-epimerase